MTSSRNVVSTQIYALNLAVSDTVKGCQIIKDAFDTAFEVSNVFRLSPKRAAQ